jgi:hypothetical protein
VTPPAPAARFSVIYPGGAGPGIQGLRGGYLREVWVFGAHGPLVFILNGQSWPIEGGQQKQVALGNKTFRVNATSASNAQGNAREDYVFADQTGAWTKIQIGTIDSFGRLRMCNVRHPNVGPAGWMNNHRAVLTPNVDCP